VQVAYARFLAEDDSYLRLADFYQQKRDLFLQQLNASRFKPLACRGTYFQLVDYSAISDAPDVEMAGALTRTHGVAAIPVSVFNHDGRDHKLLRFCFAKKDNTLRQAGAKLCLI